MKSLIRKLKNYFVRSGSSLSGYPDRTGFKPKPQPVRSSVTIDEPDEPQPDDDGWIKMPNGDRYRKIKCGYGSDMSLVEDDPGPGRRTRIVSRGFQLCRGCGRRVPERLRGGLCSWCLGA